MKALPLLAAALLAAVPAAAQKVAPTPKGLLYRAQNSYKTHDYEAAVEFLRELGQQPSLSQADAQRGRELLAASLLGMGEKEAAKAALAQVLADDPEFKPSSSVYEADFLALVEGEKKRTPQEREASARAAEQASKKAAEEAARRLAEREKAEAQARAQAEVARRTIAVAVLLPAVSGEAVAPKAAQAYASALIAELRKLQDVKVVGPTEPPPESQSADCSGQLQCLARIGSALGVDELLTSHIAMVGNRATVALTRAAFTKSNALQTHTRALDAGNGDELLALVGIQVEALYPGRELIAGRVRGVDRALARNLLPPPLSPWAFGGTLLAAAAAGGAGAWMGTQSKSALADYSKLLDRSATEWVDGAELNAKLDRARNFGTGATVAFVGAGVLGAAAIVELFFTDWSGGGPRPLISVTPAPGGLGLAARF